jgi:hypothetical protein
MPTHRCLLPKRAFRGINTLSSHGIFCYVFAFGRSTSSHRSIKLLALTVLEQTPAKAITLFSVLSDSIATREFHHFRDGT